MTRKLRWSKLDGLRYTARVLIIGAMALTLLPACSSEKEVLRAEGVLGLTPQEKSATTENTVNIEIDKSAGKVKGTCNWHIDTGREVLKTYIDLQGTFTASGNKGAGSMSGKATATFEYYVNGQEQTKPAKTSTWSATLDESGLLSGTISGQSFSAWVKGAGMPGGIVSPSPGEITTSEPATGIAQFKVTNLRVTEGSTSGTFNASVDIENTGNAAGIYHLAARVDDKVVQDSDERLEPGEKITVPLPQVEARLSIIYLEDVYEARAHIAHTVAVGDLSVKVEFTE